LLRLLKMPISATFIIILSVLVAALVVTMLTLRGRQKILLARRRAQHQLRGAAHIRELALATQIYTGRNDIALALLPLATQMLDEAIHLTPRDPALAQALRECRNLNSALRDGTAPSGPELASALDSEGALNRARMELIEAARLLGRADKLEGVHPTALQDMVDALKQTQRSVELRLNLRQAAQVAALHNPAAGDTRSSEVQPLQPPPQARANPSR
jgi:hypothetical protein